MIKVDCKDCQFYHNGRCEELGEYTTPGECECYWFARRVNKKRCVAEIAKNAKQTVFHRITASPEVLAPYLVSDDEWGFHSSITDKGEREDIGAYDTEEEAITATVAKLNEIEK